MTQKLLYTLFLGFLLACSAQAQSSTHPDTLERLARKSYGTDPDLSRSYAGQVLNAEIRSSNSEKYAWALNWTAICYLRTGPADSVDHYLKACIAFCEKEGLPGIAGKARLNQSINYYQQGNLDSAAAMGLHALRMFEQSGDSLGIGHALYNTALNYQRLERNQEAREYYKQAEPIYREYGSGRDVAKVLNALGTLCNERNAHDSAIVYFEEAIALKTEAGLEVLCGSEYSNLASSLEQQGKYAEAKSYFRRALSAFTAIGDDRGQSLASINLGKRLREEGITDSAVWYVKQGVELANAIGDLYKLTVAYEELSKSLEANGQLEEAITAQRQYMALQDSVTGLEVQANADQLRIQYQSEKQERELAEKDAALVREELAGARKDLWIWLSVSAGLILALVLILIINRQRTQRRRQEQKAREDLEKERLRISMDLHDHLGAELTIISSRLDAQAFRAESPDLQNSLTALADQSREAGAQLRETIWSVRSESINLQQLQGKTREFANRVLEGSEMKYHDTLEGSATLPPALALDLYRILQEAITNARKHSQGKSIMASFTMVDGEFVCTVQDDGIGLSDANSSQGYGLQNMQERLREWNGEVTLETRNGTYVHIRVPVS